MKDELNIGANARPIGFVCGLWPSRPRAASSFGLTVGFALLSAVTGFAQTNAVPPSLLLNKSSYVAQADPNKEVNVVFTLPLSDPKGAVEFVKQVSTRGHALYQHYLTPEEFAAKFGGSSADYAALKEWAAANGLAITREAKARTALTVHGTVGQFQNIFKTRINTYRSPNGRQFDSAETQLMVPSSISAKVSGVIGLTEGERYHPLYQVAKTLGDTEELAAGKGGVNPDFGGTGPGGTYSPADLRKAYNIPNFGKLDKHTVVAVFEQGGFRESDVTRFLDRNNLPHQQITPVSVNGAPTTVSRDVELEAVLDIDMIFGIDPDVSEVLVYEDGVDPFPTALLDAIIQVGDDNKAQILSISYGQDEALQGQSAIEAENNALIQLAAEGITVFASSGDSGAYGDGSNYPYNVADPASQPYITGVGGTTLFTGKGGQYVTESAWNTLAAGFGATGGGVSSYWALPNFQGEPDVNSGDWGTVQYCSVNGGSIYKRNVPDVSAVGDPVTGVGVYCQDKGGWVQIGGTSLSAPIWAGYLGIINAVYHWAGMNNVGYFNLGLYNMDPADGNPSAVCLDVFQGSNGYANTANPGYTNGAGYSNTTGNGSPWGTGFLVDYLAFRPRTGPYPGVIAKVNIKVQGTTVKLSWTPSTLAIGYIVEIAHPGISDNLVNAYLTKETNYEVTGLLPDYNKYVAFIWAFNQNGGMGYGPLYIATH